VVSKVVANLRVVHPIFQGPTILSTVLLLNNSKNFFLN